MVITSFPEDTPPPAHDSESETAEIAAEKGTEENWSSINEMPQTANLLQGVRKNLALRSIVSR
jgi:hypothetical protein